MAATQSKLCAKDGQVAQAMPWCPLLMTEATLLTKLCINLTCPFIDLCGEDGPVAHATLRYLGTHPE